MNNKIKTIDIKGKIDPIMITNIAKCLTKKTYVRRIAQTLYLLFSSLILIGLAFTIVCGGVLTFDGMIDFLKKCVTEHVHEFLCHSKEIVGLCTIVGAVCVPLLIAFNKYIIGPFTMKYKEDKI